MFDPAERTRRRAAAARDRERRRREEEQRQREDEELRVWRQQEPPTEAEARLRSMRDAALELVIKNSSNNPGAALMRQELARRFPDVSSDQYAQVYFDLFDECLKVLDEARKLAVMNWQERLSRAEALRQLQERCPGFSFDVYAAAFNDWRTTIR